jgi:hypothetical protein
LYGKAPLKNPFLHFFIKQQMETPGNVVVEQVAVAMKEYGKRMGEKCESIPVVDKEGARFDIVSGIVDIPIEVDYGVDSYNTLIDCLHKSLNGRIFCVSDDKDGDGDDQHQRKIISVLPQKKTTTTSPEKQQQTSFSKSDVETKEPACLPKAKGNRCCCCSGVCCIVMLVCFLLLLAVALCIHVAITGEFNYPMGNFLPSTTTTTTTITIEQ